MIYQSCHQIMFVQYMPFLLMAFSGVDRYWEKGKTGLYTLGTNPEEQAVFSFTQSYQHEDAVGDYPESYITTDTTTGYVWKDGTLAPYRRISLTYYSADDIYCLSVSDFNELLGEFLDPDDKWLSRQEYSQTDFSFLYYFR